MKKLFLIALISATAGAALAQDFSATIRRSRVSTTPTTERLVRQGSLQRVARSGNIAQAVNPRAPREYGNGAEFVENRDYDPMLKSHDHSREHPVALRLFAFEF